MSTEITTVSKNIFSTVSGNGVEVGCDDEQRLKMKKKGGDYMPIKVDEALYCSHCGAKLCVAYVNSKVRKECPRCKAVSISTLISALHKVIDVHLPEK
jgi:phage FluMu protein Com